MEINRLLIKQKEWEIKTVNIAPGDVITVPELIGKSELWIYFGGSWSQRKMMYFDYDLSNQGVVMETNHAAAANDIAKFGASIDFEVGTIRNDVQSTTNIIKIKYR